MNQRPFQAQSPDTPSGEIHNYEYRKYDSLHISPRLLKLTNIVNFHKEAGAQNPNEKTRNHGSESERSGIFLFARVPVLIRFIGKDSKFSSGIN